MAEASAVEERASGAPGVRGGQPHYQPQLDGVRGIAILAVLLSHAAAIIGGIQNGARQQKILDWLTPGWGGVDLFFALSGFLITGILLRGRRSETYFKPFYARRALRIFPIYYLVLFGSLLLCTQIPALATQMPTSDAHLPASVLQRFSFFIYLQNFPVFWPGLALGLTGLWGPYWSLAVEEQFYFVWPALVRYLRISSLYWLSIGIVLLGPLTRTLVARHTGETLGLLQFPLSRLDGLFAGAALALYRECKGKPPAKLWAALWFVLGCSILAYIAVFHRVELVSPGYYINRFGISGFVLISVGLIAATQHEIPGYRQLMTAAPLRAFGRYSYGIYVYHAAIFLLFHRLRRAVLPVVIGDSALLRLCALDTVAIMTAFLVAWLSYRFLEAPILALKRFFPSPGGPPRELETSQPG